MTLYEWHLVFLAVMAYVIWHFVGMFPLRSWRHKEENLNFINFGMSFTLGVLVFACLSFMYYSDPNLFPATLLQASYVSWTLTVCAILWLSGFPPSIKIVAFSLIIGTAILHYQFGGMGGVTGFLKKLDNFTQFGGRQTGSLKLSIFLKWAFFFFNVFIVLHYYGKIFQIVHLERIEAGKRAEGLEQEAVRRAILVITVGLSIFLALTLVGTDVKSLSLFSGLVAAGVSIALKDLLANMAAGVLLLWDKSIKKNDVIALDKDRFGVVRSMTMRYLVLEDRNDIRFLVPNSELITNTITNWTQGTRKIRLKLDVGISPEADLSKVRSILKEICLRVPRVLQDPPPRVLVMGCGDATINIQLRFFIEDPEMGVRNVMSEIYELLLFRFKEAKVKIPMPQTEIRILPESALDVNLHKQSRTWLDWLAAR